MSELPIRTRRRDKLKGKIFRGRSSSQTPVNTLGAESTSISQSSEGTTVPSTTCSTEATPPTESGPSIALANLPNATSSSNSPTPPDPGTIPPPPSNRDLWADALSKLPEVEQNAIRSIRTIQDDAAVSSTERMTELVTLIRKKQRQCEEKAYKFRFQGQDIILRDVAEKIMVFLNKFKAVGDVVVNFDPIHAALPWAGVRFLLQAAVGEQEQTGALLLGTEKISYLTNRCIIYESLYQADTTPNQVLENLHVALVDLYAAMLRLVAVAHRLLSKHTVSRATHALFNPNEMNELLRTCDELERRVDIEAGNCHRVCSQEADTKALEWLDGLRKPISRIDGNVLSLLQKVGDNERHHILYWTSPVLYGKNHDTVCAERTKNTCQWVLQHKHFQEWRESSSSMIIWLHGTAGTGKTFLTSKVIDEVQNSLQNNPNHEGFAYFYCNRNEVDRMEPLSILRSFVRQLSTITHEKDMVQKRLGQLYHECREKSREPTVSDCRDILREYIDLYPRTTIVLDALDECDKYKREILVDFFDDLVVSATKPVKIFISSRPDVDIKDRFKTRSNIEILATDNQEDISLYVRTEMKKHRNWEKFSPSLQTDIVETLESRGNGMFQWVYLQIKQLLDLRLEKQVRQRLGKLPKDLKAAYEEILESMSDDHKKFAYRAFQWVMVAHKPLQSEVLLEAVCQDPDAETRSPMEDLDEDILLEYCHNLLIIDSQRGVWIPSHLSVIEYLEDHLWTRQEAHCLVANVTLLALNDSSIYEAMSVDASRDSERWRESYDSFNDYAINCWITHVHQCDMQLKGNVKVGSRVSALLKQFLGSPIESSQAYRVWYDCRALRKRDIWLHSVDISDLEPPFVASFVICAYGLYTPLLDWWESPWPNLQITNRNGKSLLALATGSRSLPICENLIQWGADVNEQFDAWPGNPLAVAASSTDNEEAALQMATLLIESGAEINQQIQSIPGVGTALIAAVYSGNLKMLELLVHAGADVNQLRTCQSDRRFPGSPLAAAAHFGHAALMKFLLDAGARVNTPIQHGHYGSALIAGADNDNIEVMKLLLKAGADINMPIQYGRYGSALIASAEKGNIEVVELLLEAGAEVNVPTKCGNYGSALIAGAQFGRIEVVKLLLKAGADFNVPTKCGKYGSALIAGASSGNIEVVKLLFEAGAEVDMPIRCGDYGNALIAGASSGNIEVVKLLFEAGAEVDMPIRCGKYGSALIASAGSNNIEIVQLLFEAGAEVNILAQCGYFGSVLGAAAYGGQPELVALLLNAGAKVNQPFRQGYYGSALAAAASGFGRGSSEVVKLLLDFGADVNMPLSNGRSGNALSAALERNGRKKEKYEMGKQLLEAGADANQLSGASADMGSPLAVAAKTGDPALVKLLLDVGADVNMLLEHGECGNALSAACLESAEVVELLIEAGAEVNVPLNHGVFGSALATAAYRGDCKIIKVLLDAGADVNMPLHHGKYRNVLEIARDNELNNRDPEVEKLLLEAGAVSICPDENV